MPRLIALEWDNTEVRIAVGRVRKGHVDLDHALVAPIAPEARSPIEIGGQIKKALGAIGVNGGDALVAVGRSAIELRFLSVPPVPPDELPDLVRFQATRQFSQSFEDGLLDYAPLASSGSPPTSVLAAAITPELLKTVRETCDAAGVSLKHLVLRPFAADSLVIDRLSADSCVLTIDRLAEEVDLTVVLGEQAVFPRTVRVSSHGTMEEQATLIVGEVRRTIAASSNQVAGKRVESIIVFGRPSEQPTLAEQIRRDLSLAVEFVDPLEAVTVSESLARSLPAAASRFAPLVGMLVDESRGRRHEIDFLAPRRKPAPPDRRVLYGLIGGVAAALFLAIVGYFYMQLSSLDGEIQALKAEGRDLDKTLKALQPKVEHAKLLDEYAAGKTVWLEEFRELATELPPADRLILREIVADVSQQGPTISLQGGAKESKDIPEMEARIRDARHRISGAGGDEVDDKLYPWSFSEKIVIVPPSAAGTPAPAPRRTR